MIFVNFTAARWLHGVGEEDGHPFICDAVSQFIGSLRGRILGGVVEIQRARDVGIHQKHPTVWMERNRLRSIPRSSTWDFELNIPVTVAMDERGIAMLVLALMWIIFAVVLMYLDRDLPSPRYPA